MRKLSWSTVPVTGFYWLRGPVMGRRLPAFVLRAFGPQTCRHGHLGKTTWADWLARH